MSHPTDRVALFTRDMDPLPELTANEVFSRVRSEELNGEHSLTIETTRHLQEGWRALTRDATGKWREWVVTEVDEEHASGEHAIGTYHLVWSLQYDLTLSYYHDMDEAVSIGIGNRCTSLEAAQHVLTGVANWTVGTCDAPDIVPGEPVYAPDGLTPKNSNKINTRGRVKGHPDQAGCVFVRESAWSKLSKLVKCAFYEVDAEIDVSAVGNVTARRLCLRDHLGNVEALRRFDWSEDLTGIKRKPDPGPYYCRVVPLGKTQEEYADDDVTKFNWPMDITEETGTEGNPGPYWIQDDEAAAVFRIKQPDGSYVYPTVAVEYNDEDDPELLLRAAQLDLHNHTRPGVTYEASVIQLSEAGMDVHSVALGDEVQAVDYGFNEDVGLRIEGRVTKIEVDELAPESTMEITIGQLRDNMTDFLHSMNTEMDTAFEQLLAQHSELAETLMQMTTAKYVDELLDRINTEINGTGGYTYIIPGEGIITYDKEVSDPLVGSEAGRVVQLKGGYLRIADTKKSPFAGIDDWEFNTLLDAGHIIADLITAVKITSGYIGNATNSNYWNLDSGELILRYLTAVGIVETKHGAYTMDGSIGMILNGHYGNTYENTTTRVGFTTRYTTSQPSSSQRLLGSISIFPLYQYFESAAYAEAVKNSYWNSIASNLNLHIISNYSNSSYSALALHENYATLYNATAVSGSQSGSQALPDGVNYSRQNVTSSVTVNSDSIRLRVQAPNVLQLRKVELTSSDGLTIFNAPIDLRSTITSGIFSTLNTGSFANSNNGLRAGPKLYVSDSDTDDSGYDQKPGNGSIIAKNLYIGSTGQTNTNSGTVVIRGSLSLNGSYIGTGSKSRSVETDDYDDRLLFCYETPTPMFGDIGSGLIGEDGICYVQIDDIFSETANTSASYQVFLQKCGRGDLWVSEKHLGYFVVEGTPGLAFDWELKARQFGYESMRLEDTDSYMSFERGAPDSVDESRSVMRLYGDIGTESSLVADSTESVYDDYISDIEHLYDDDLAA